MNSNWYVYLVRCMDNSLYCGITTNIYNRIKSHNDGTGAKYTKNRRPVVLETYVGPMSKSNALKLEIQIKKLPTNKKIQELSKYNELLSL